MTRALALFVVVFMLAMQKGDGPTARASVCLDRDCRKTSAQGFEPATVRVSYLVPIHSDNSAAQFGLVCAQYESISAWQLDGEREKIPAWLVTYRDVPDGTCRAAIIVYRRDGSQQSGRSDPILILSRD